MPLIDAADKFLIIGIRLDLETRRPILVCEQVIYTDLDDIVILPSTPGGPSHDCFIQLADVQEPLTLVADERWEPDVVEPTTQVADERWELVLDNALAGTLFTDERWES